MIVLLSTIMQYEHPRIHHNYWSSPRSSVSYGLQWLLALHAKAMATAWDLITQTHLELWGQLQDGILMVASLIAEPHHQSCSTVVNPLLLFISDLGIGCNFGGSKHGSNFGSFHSGTNLG
jgi:hypothetical protein